jgi:hypothetical protein
MYNIRLSTIATSMWSPPSLPIPLANSDVPIAVAAWTPAMYCDCDSEYRTGCSYGPTVYSTPDNASSTISVAS